jgi:TatD DNase family protein
MRLVDAHAHLEWPSMSNHIPDIITRAKAHGITMVINSASRVEDYPRSLELMNQYPEMVRFTLGVHPEFAFVHEDVISRFKTFFLENIARYCGIGEIGLDFLAIKDHSQRAQGELIFRELLAFAQTVQKPVVIHCRNAEKQTLEILGEYPSLSGVILHCFGGPEKFIKMGLDRGYYFTIPTSITFKKLHQELARLVPLDRMLLETDAPFLSPFPENPINEPKNVDLVAKAIAEIKNIPIEDVASMTTKNALSFFHLEAT